MFLVLPVGDKNPLRTTPVVTWALILANVAISFYYMLYRPDRAEPIVNEYALRPGQWHDLKTLISSMFLHGDLLHLFGNMLFLYIVGDNIEDRVGHVPYLLFYLLAGIAGSAAHVAYTLLLAKANADIPTVGASGAISGMIGAYLVFFPGGKIKFMVWIILFIRYFTLPAWGAIGFWIAGQVMMARDQLSGIAKGDAQRVAVFAHLGGAAFGFVVAFLVRTFGKPPKKPSSD
ncbi:MAG TPA: rhomboid family intramembrane serine protease [Planctomycetota bacterium]